MPPFMVGKDTNHKNKMLDNAYLRLEQRNGKSKKNKTSIVEIQKLLELLLQYIENGVRPISS